MEKLSLEIDARILEWDSYWKIFKFNKGELTKWKELLLALKGSSWPVKSFLKSKSNVKVRGILHITELVKGVILIAPEIISKSANFRTIFRIIVMEDYALVQDDEESISKKFLQNYICPIFDLTDNDIEEIRINAMKIRKLVKHIKPIKLTLLVNNQTAGVEGLENITLTGQNVIRGIKTLKDRQEVDLKADSIGPWIELESEEIKFKMGKGIILKNTSKKVFDIIQATMK